MSAPATVDGDLVAALRGAGLSDVDGSGLARALYSSDASLYRVVPQVVVRPRHGDELSASMTPASGVSLLTLHTPAFQGS